MIPAPHGPSCNARTYRTTCRYCDNTIYVFQCDCESAVLFDRLGPPWPKHHCHAAGSEGLEINLGNLNRDQLQTLASLFEKSGTSNINLNEGETVFDALQRLAEEERLRDAMQCGIYSAQSVAEESANEIVSRMSAREFSVPENLDVTVHVYLGHGHDVVGADYESQTE